MVSKILSIEGHVRVCKINGLSRERGGGLLAEILKGKFPSLKVQQGCKTVAGTLNAKEKRV